MQSLQHVPGEQTIQFLEPRTPCVPRPCAAEVISQFRNKKRQYNESFEKEPYPYTSLVSQDILSTHSHMERFSQPVSFETEGDLAHTQQSIACVSPSQVGEQCDRSRYVSAQSHLRGLDGKSRKFDPAKVVVSTPLCVTGPRARLRSNLDDTKPVACRPVIRCGKSGCTGSCPLSSVECGYTGGKKPATCWTCGKHSRDRTSLSQTLRPPKVKG